MASRNGSQSSAQSKNKKDTMKKQASGELSTHGEEGKTKRVLNPIKTFFNKDGSIACENETNKESIILKNKGKAKPRKSQNQPQDAQALPCLNMLPPTKPFPKLERTLSELNGKSKQQTHQGKKDINNEAGMAEPVSNLGLPIKAKQSRHKRIESGPQKAQNVSKSPVKNLTPDISRGLKEGHPNNYKNLQQLISTINQPHNEPQMVEVKSLSKLTKKGTIKTTSKKDTSVGKKQKVDGPVETQNFQINTSQKEEISFQENSQESTILFADNDVLTSSNFLKTGDHYDRINSSMNNDDTLHLNRSEYASLMKDDDSGLILANRDILKMISDE